MTVEPPEPLDAADVAAVAWQLGRAPRGALAVAHRCPCGDPDVLLTAPRLPDGSPFPTLYYLTCPAATGAVGTLESLGLMHEMEARLSEDVDLANTYRAAHQSYLEQRDAIEVVPELDGISAGGMPSRVKCLHVLVAHSLAVGPGVNPFGDEAGERLPDWWSGPGCRGQRLAEESSTS